MIRTAVALAALWSSAASAHEGEHHGGLLVALMHLVSQPDHVALLAAAAILGGVGAVVMRRRTRAPRRLFGRQ
jgi:hydrogenase/urease accessory protein HupE